jgi:hemerythrin-like domain-containing protein
MGDHAAEIDGLIDEHRDLMTIMAALNRAGGDPDSNVNELLDELETKLGHHTEREESGLFHVLRQVDVPARYVALFEHDHGHLVDLIHSSRTGPQRVAELLSSLEAHMAREENDMFPAAEQLLGPSDWDAVRAAIADVR